ncbi:HIT family protein [Candidatus Woesearchaeota archaeon]|nr:HIT family protein [Candidatus Woesearchaeota archaeon]
MTIAVSNLKKEMNIYEDEKAMVYLHEHPCAPGHLVVFPKQDTSSLENLDAETFAHLTTVASFASTAIFEALQLQGTNMIVQSGSASANPYDRFCIHIIPRLSDDGISFQWKPKKAEGIENIQESIRNQTFFIGKQDTPKKQEQLPEEPKQDFSDQENYLLKHLRRVP